MKDPNPCLSWLAKPVAHRGFFNLSDAPENSMKAFDYALKAGLAVEMDVQQTKDGAVIVFHDETLNRMTGVKGDVAHWTLKDLQSLYLNQTDQTIPTLKEVLDLVQGRIPLHIEIKQEGVVGDLENAVLAVLENYAGPYCILSFNVKSLMYVKKHNPQIPRVLNVSKILSFETLRGMLWAKPVSLNAGDWYASLSQINFFKKFIPIGIYTLKSQEAYSHFEGVAAPLIFEDVERVWFKG